MNARKQLFDLITQEGIYDADGAIDPDAAVDLIIDAGWRQSQRIDPDADLISKARSWAANFDNSKGAERLNSAYYIKALADELERIGLNQ